MSVYRWPGCDSYFYEFVLNGKRHRGTTKLTPRRGVRANPSGRLYSILSNS